jgi:hypothetical protein
MVMLFERGMSERETHKRPAEDALDGDQRLAKRLNLLHLSKHARN